MIDRDEAWVLRCIEHKKRNGIGTGIEKDGKCEFWFKEGFDAALQAGTSHNSNSTPLILILSKHEPVAIVDSMEKYRKYNCEVKTWLSFYLE